MLRAYILILLAGLCASCASVKDTEPGVIRGEVVKLADGFEFTEGPASDGRGNVYFTDQPNDRIMIWGVNGKLSTFMQPSGRANGLSFDKKGNLWACADGNNELWRIGKDKKVDVVVTGYNGKRLNAPNDLWITDKGGVYFTDPFYKRDYWTHDAKEQPFQGVYYLNGDGKLSRVTKDLVKANGIIGTPDGKMLYVADIGAWKTYSYTINADGTLSDKRLFCELGSDGMTIDDEENVYLTGKGVSVFDRYGNKIDHVEIDEPWTANVCFGGKDRRSLFITAGKRLYMVRTKTRGARSQ